MLWMVPWVPWNQDPLVRGSINTYYFFIAIVLSIVDVSKTQHAVVNPLLMNATWVSNIVLTIV